MAFQYNRRAKGKPKLSKDIPQPDRTENEEEVQPIQGIMPGSREEYRVALALMQLKLEFIFQYQIRGGRSVRGGQVIDFLVFTPFETPLLVHGEYWHSGQLGQDDRLKEAELEAIFQREVVIVWGVEATSVETAKETLRRKLL